VKVQDTALSRLKELGYIIYREKAEDFGLLRQSEDNTKGLEWKG
jgi:hypothetical protein